MQTVGHSREAQATPVSVLARQFRRWLKLKTTLACCALLLFGTGAPSYALSLTDPVSSWPCVLESEREELATLLTTVVGGRPELDEYFFEACIAELAWEPNFYARQIRDVANGCSYMSTLVFSDSG
jgi:hypothetical protein